MALALLGSAALVLGLSVTPLTAGATTSIVETGWWSSSPFAEAPEGGLVVGKAPNGPTSVAALRLELGRGIDSASLSVTESGGFGQDVAAIAVCRGTDDWIAVANGPLATAPEPQCPETPRLLTRDSSRWTVDLTGVLGDASGRVTIMLVAGTSSDPAGALGLGWEVQLNPPTFQASEVAGPTTTTLTTLPAGGLPPSATPATNPPASRPSSAGPSASSPRVTIPATTTTTSLAVAGAAADAPPTRPLLAPGGDAEGRPWGRLGGFLLLSSLLGAAAGGARWLATSGPLERIRIPFLRR